MKYIREYCQAFTSLFIIMGTLIFLIKCLFFQDFLADYFFYVVVVGAISGPISLKINKKESA